ncbi:MAG: hypothetical protein KDC76_11525 [Bacteroidetes bacterium]|nr:hypothetical protein [Bacteroidota bacterium]
MNKTLIALVFAMVTGSMIQAQTLPNLNLDLSSAIRFKAGLGFSNQEAVGFHHYFIHPEDIQDGNRDTTFRAVSSYLARLNLEAELYPVYHEKFGVGFTYMNSPGFFPDAIMGYQRYGPTAFYNVAKFQAFGSWLTTSRRFSYRRDSAIDIHRIDQTRVNWKQSGSAIQLGVGFYISEQSVLRFTYMREKLKAPSLADSLATQTGFILSFDKEDGFEIKLEYFPKYVLLRDNRIDRLVAKREDLPYTFKMFRLAFSKVIDFK